MKTPLFEKGEAIVKKVVFWDTFFTVLGVTAGIIAIIFAILAAMGY